VTSKDRQGQYGLTKFFGKKKGGDGCLYDFNAIYSQLIKSALEMAGLEAFRADEKTTSSDVLTDMLQELLLADVCIADMSIDNANSMKLATGLSQARHRQGSAHRLVGRQGRSLQGPGRALGQAHGGFDTRHRRYDRTN